MRIALRRAIVESARLEVGTPFVHQGRRPGKALDCVGLPVVVAQRLGLPYEDETSYPRTTDGWVLQRCLNACADRVPLDDVGLGDLLVFLRGRGTWHVGIVSSLRPLTMIHAWSRKTNSCVREEPISREWLNRINSAWRFRDDDRRSSHVDHGEPERRVRPRLLR
jgi:cell wall-associated NlpC family hydrolase